MQVERLHELRFGSNDPSAIFLIAEQPSPVVADLLDQNQAPLSESILRSSLYIERIDILKEKAQNLELPWEQLVTESELNNLQIQSGDLRAQLDALEIEPLKATVLGLTVRAEEYGALLTLLVLRLLKARFELKQNLDKIDNRVQLCRYYLVMNAMCHSIDWSSSVSARSITINAANILDEILDLALQPIPDEWIIQIEDLELKVESIDWSKVGTVPIMTNRQQAQAHSGFELPVLNKVEDDELSGIWQSQQVDLAREAEKQRVQASTRKLEIEEARIYKQRLSALELVDSEATNSTTIDEHNALHSTHSVRPNSLTSVTSSIEGYSTDASEFIDTHITSSTTTSAATSPERPEQRLVSEVLLIPGKGRPVSQPTFSTNLKSIDALALTGEPLSERPKTSNGQTESELTTGVSRQREIIDKDMYRGHVRPVRSSGTSNLAPDDPKRSSVDVANLRAVLAAKAGAERIDPLLSKDQQRLKSVQRSLDLKIQHILDELHSNEISLNPVEDDAGSSSVSPSAKTTTLKVISTKSTSHSKEAGYGSTRKYMLMRPNAQPQVIWVRIIAERVMVRVGGGWTDLSEWLSNYIMYHSSSSEFEVSKRQVTSPANSSTKQNRLSWTKKQDSPSATPSKSSPSSGSDSRKRKSHASDSSSRRSSWTTPLGSAGPESSVDVNAKLSGEKKAWVQKMLKQVSSQLVPDEDQKATPKSASSTPHSSPNPSSSVETPTSESIRRKLF
ncbi:uncharacterized protein V1516DRAFT_672743, partial [Lipomyces oligophaga]|uniref:uncharacterized protein n=1 Tax=Lipomyces oligophaga TaxID=45792 RepID=UPI0034CEB39A